MLCIRKCVHNVGVMLHPTPLIIIQQPNFQKAFEFIIKAVNTAKKSEWSVMNDPIAPLLLIHLLQKCIYIYYFSPPPPLPPPLLFTSATTSWCTMPLSCCGKSVGHFASLATTTCTCVSRPGRVWPEHRSTAGRRIQGGSCRFSCESGTEYIHTYSAV